ncbi:hypothetical protein [Gilvibacter sp.]|uniref:hypothetical protein n=1 Tax=Gilvibacter sp. TaxID=2729997 RepID=UPI003F49EAD3
MAEKARLLWDFRGPAAAQTAVHHVIHLNEFFEREPFSCYETGVLEQSPMWQAAFAIVDLNDAQKLREILKPHRGQRITEGS